MPWPGTVNGEQINVPLVPYAVRHGDWSNGWLALGADRLVRAVQRNPRGWETWLAIQSDEAREHAQWAARHVGAWSEDMRQKAD